MLLKLRVCFPSLRKFSHGGESHLEPELVFLREVGCALVQPFKPGISVRCYGPHFTSAGRIGEAHRLSRNFTGPGRHDHIIRLTKTRELGGGAGQRGEAMYPRRFRMTIIELGNLYCCNSN